MEWKWIIRFLIILVNDDMAVVMVSQCFEFKSTAQLLHF